MEEILTEWGVSHTREQVTSIIQDFMLHVEMEREIESYQHVGRKETCNKCDAKDAKIKQLEYEISIYQKSVKGRIKRAEHVYIENGTVKYDIV